MKNIILAVSLVSVSLLCGCASTQVVNFSKGTGLDMDLPIGYNGANLLEMKLRIGQFYSATAVQPVSTNDLHTTAVAFASSTDGNVTAPQVGSSNTASVTGGDKFTASIAGGSGSVSNTVGTATSQSVK